MFNFTYNTNRITRIVNNKYYTKNYIKPMFLNRLKLFFLFSRKKIKNILKILNICFFLFFFFKGKPFFINRIKNQNLIFGIILKQNQIYYLVNLFLWQENIFGRTLKLLTFHKQYFITIFSKFFFNFRHFQVYNSNYFFRLLNFPKILFFGKFEIKFINFSKFFKLYFKDFLKFFGLDLKMKKKYLF